MKGPKLEYKIITKLKEKQKDDLLELYKKEFWSRTRVRQDIYKMLENTDIVVGLEDASGRLIGFCRVLTDDVYKATIYDLIIALEQRNKDLGKVLMEKIMGHKDL